ncbi:MAG: response regulator [Gammaproteobacteria bacterium]|nr:response regulator [Gammaproteobacteria bacterium]
MITVVGFIVVISAVSTLMLVSFRHMAAMQAGIEEISVRYNRKASLTYAMNEAINQRMALVRDLMLEPERFKREQLLQRFYHYGWEFQKNYQEMMTLSLDRESERLLEQVITRIQESSSIRERVENLVTNSKPADREELLSTVITIHRLIISQLNELASLQHSHNMSQLKVAREDYHHTRDILAFIFVIILLSALLITIRISRYIRNNARSLTQMAHDKSMLLATMSHEIRTPLTSIIGFGESLLDVNNTKEERISAINAILRNSHHLHGVINNVLDYSKIDSNQMEINDDWIDLKACMDDLQYMMQGRAQSKGLSFDILSNGPIPARIHNDEMRLRQVLINLANNAIKFTEQGSVTVTVECEETGPTLKFMIEDTGIGMSEKQIRNLFTPYRQFTQSQQQEGTGLGLYISREMTHLMGGELEVQSEPTVGSRFTLSIPTGDINGVERIEWTGPLFDAVQEIISQRVHLSGRVLLADDLKDNQKLFSILLDKTGIDLTIVNNGREAVDEALAHEYSLILMDMKMPVMDGVTATRELRAKGYNKPIVALTANDTQSERQACREAGFDGFLSKPIERTSFNAVLTRYLERKDLFENDGPIFSSALEELPELQPAVDYFVGQLPVRRESIEQALISRDWHELKELVHDLKGTAGGVGYEELTELAMKVEFAIAKEDYTEVNFLVDQLVNRVERIQSGYIQRYGTEPPATNGYH